MGNSSPSYHTLVFDALDIHPLGGGREEGASLLRFQVLGHILKRRYHCSKTVCQKEVKVYVFHKFYPPKSVTFLRSK